MARLLQGLVQACLLASLAVALTVRPAQQDGGFVGLIGDTEPEPGPAAAPGKYAFVMMAFDPPGAPPRSLWGVLPMAHAVRQLSQYPLVVLTNTTHFPDGTEVASSLARLGVQVLPVLPVPVPEPLLREHRFMPCQEVDPPVCQYQFLKLQIWRLTQFDKLIWMDSDAILARGVDSLFGLPGTWAQQDNWDCGSAVSAATRFSPSLTRLVDWVQRELPSEPQQQQSSGVCSGFLLLEPSETRYEALVRYMGAMDSAPGGDQQVIADYFEALHEPVKLLNVSTASFGQCVGKAIPGGVTPAFVHKSEWVNSCFRLGAEASECRQLPLGHYWHDHFCRAALLAQLSGKLGGFCSAWT